MSGAIDRVRLLATVEQETERIGACLAAGPDRPVPSCPGWDLATLAAHLGQVQRWAEIMVRTGAEQRLDRSQLPAPPEGAARSGWLLDGARELVDSLRAAGGDRRVWTFAGPDGLSAFWARRMAYEAQIHRADAELALGSSPAVAPDLAADGVDEFLQVMLPRCFARGPVPNLAGVLELGSDDGGPTWTVTISPTAAEVVPGPSGEADCRVRGPAADLFLFVWNRPTGPALRIAGERQLVHRWQQAVRV